MKTIEELFPERRLSRLIQEFFREWGAREHLKTKEEYSVVLSGDWCRTSPSLNQSMRKCEVNPRYLMKYVHELSSSIRVMRMDRRDIGEGHLPILHRLAIRTSSKAYFIRGEMRNASKYKLFILEEEPSEYCRSASGIRIKKHWCVSVFDKGIAVVSHGSDKLFVENAKRIDYGDEPLGITAYKVSAVSFRKSLTRLDGYVLKHDTHDGRVITAFGPDIEKARRLLNRRVTAAVMSKLLD
jgi:hypothetical protein